MYKLCKTEQSAQRQKEIERALFSIMDKKNYVDITITEICLSLNMPRKTFYRYFDSKDGCLHALLDHIIMNGSAYYMSNADDEDTSLTFCIRIFEYWQRQTPLLNALEKNGQSLQLLQRMIRYILEEEPDYARYMGIPQHRVMEHVVARDSRPEHLNEPIMGLTLEMFNLTPTQVADVLEVIAR